MWRAGFSALADESLREFDADAVETQAADWTGWRGGDFTGAIGDGGERGPVAQIGGGFHHISSAGDADETQTEGGGDGGGEGGGDVGGIGAGDPFIAVAPAVAIGIGGLRGI